MQKSGGLAPLDTPFLAATFTAMLRKRGWLVLLCVGEMLTATAMGCVGVVLWGTLTGSTLPFVLRLFRMDPASAGHRSSRPLSMSQA